ncbi:uncharacterized protein BDW70DRAFT_157907 [Aspergillus foveolatus]|uniref:uncharacterized protein n=1 Tax=Aspergillus foveolatus TaxID=210207 RepID=UPI003CCD767A
MSTSCSNGVGGVQGDESIAKLSLLLHNALTAAGEPLPGPHYILLLSDPPLCTLSNPLLKALLVADLDSSHDSGDVLAFANQHRNEIAHTLETVSLQCFSAYLLKLPENEGFDLGLYLLADEPEYTATPDSLRSQVIVSESATLMPLVQQSLLEKTYALFTDVTGDARMRRMAGKVLAEIVSDSEEHCQMLKKLYGDEYVK